MAREKGHRLFQRKRVRPQGPARAVPVRSCRRGGGYLADAVPGRKALFAATLVTVLGLSAAQAQEATLLSHTATYELQLNSDAGRGDIDGASGVLALSIEDACDSWKVGQGVVLTVLRQESQVTTVSDYESEEAKDGSWYRFDDRTSTAPGAEEASSGQAAASPDAPGRIHVNDPAADEAVLPAGALFPTAHVVAILRGAQSGKRLMNHILYDGTEGTQIYDVTTLVGTPEVDEESGLTVWPVRLAFFLHDSSAETPDIEISARLRQDGVAMALSYDYGSFVLDAVLQKLEPLPAPDC